MTAINRLINHIELTQYQDLPNKTRQAAKTFILDSVGVGISGSRVTRVAQVKQAVQQWGSGDQAQVWVTGEYLPAGAAALINGYQIHNQEWDCVHEPAVVHPMATILSALMSYGQKEKVSGEQLILGVTIAVDVATLLGASVTSALKFFRPSICGGLGATAGICAMLGLKGDVLKNAMGIAYSQLSGTMQAHTEGSPMLAMQIGINARAATYAVDMALAGFDGPHDILEGPYGYFNLFEDQYDLSYFNQNLGKEFQIEQVSHKPFPTGRAGHGTVDGLFELQQRHQFNVDDVAEIDVAAPPLINRLVGRPAKADMDVAYAKLCNGYIAATALLSGNVTVADFKPEKLTDVTRLALAKKVVTRLNDCKDPNALAPITVSVILKNGDKHQIHLPAVLGNPQRPMSYEAQITKFTAACKSAIRPFSQQQICKLINSIDALEEISDINELIEKMIITDQ